MSFTISGVTFYQAALRRLVPDHSQGTPFRYDAQVLSEPTNAYDPNAKKVIVGGELVGYIPKGMTSKVPDGLCKVDISYWDDQSMYTVSYYDPNNYRF
jgi:hypothetical protein